jgi:hypothetical protein
MAGDHNVLCLQHVGNFRQTAAFICPVFQFTRMSGTGCGSTFRADGLEVGAAIGFFTTFPRLVSQGAQMAATSQRRRLSGEARRALQLLVDRQGSTEAWMLDLGFTDRMLFLLAQAGLITIRHEIINTGAELIDIGRVRITDAGRQALEGVTARRPSPRLQPDQ